MHGKNIEHLINILTAIKKTTALNIHKLGRMSDPRLIMIKHTHNVFVNNESPNAPHGHPSGAHIHNFWLQGNSPTKGRGFRNKISTQLTWPEDYKEDEHYQHLHDWDSDVLEKEHPVTAHDYTNPIRDIRVKYLSPENRRLEKIEMDNYEQVSSFNNEIGSPWDEMYDLEEKIIEMEAYVDDYPNLQWIGEKHTLLALMEVVLSYSIDAKWALIHFQDYVQRGYDYEFNEGIPSIRWSDFEREPNPPMDHAPGSVQDFREGRTDGNKLEIQPTIDAKVNINVLESIFGGADPFSMIKGALGGGLGGLAGNIQGALGNAASGIAGGIGGAANNIANGIAGKVPSPGNLMGGVAGKVPNPGNLASGLSGKVPNPSSLASGLGNKAGSLANNAAKNLPTKLPSKPKLPTKLPF